MNAIKHTAHYKNFDFDFCYNYIPGRKATWEDPEEYEEFEIYNVTLNGIDADFLLDSQRDEFEEEVIRQLKDY